MRKVSAKRAEERKLGTAEVLGPYAQYVKDNYACVLAGRRDSSGALHKCVGPIDPHHVEFVSQGGKDAANCLPACRFGAHTSHPKSVHGLGSVELFDAEWRIDSAAIAADIWARSPFGPGAKGGAR